MSEFNFEELFKMQMAAMRISLCHPDTVLNKYWVLNKFITMGPYLMDFFLFSNSIKYYLMTDEYFNAFNDSVPLTFMVCTTLYFALLIVNKSTMGNLIKSVKSDYTKAREFDKKRKDIMKENIEKGKTIMYIWCSLMVSGTSIFVLKSIFLTFYHTHKNGVVTLIPFHEMHYPLNITEIREHNRLLYVATFAYELYFTAMAALIYFCAVPLGPIFMLHACGQLEIIKLKFENIFEYEDVDDRLKEIVENLQYIYSFVREINECFTLIYEVMLKQSMLLLPFTTYAMIQSINHGDITIEYASIFMQALFTTSIPCYYGDLLMQKGEEVRIVAYNCGWERINRPRARQTLLVIMTRAQNPVAIETIFSQINLDTLTNVYRQAYTIFNLMTAMW